jgi:hypothetical protein
MTTSKDTTKSEKIVQRFRQQTFKSKRKRVEFSGTWNTTVNEVFPLLCPVREADWIVGWDCDLIYTESGYAEKDCIFKTNKSNPSGDGIWIMAGYETNHYIELVQVQTDVILHARVSLKDNRDGTVTGTWSVLYTGLTPEGNQQIDKLGETHVQGGTLIKMIEHYLDRGKTINPLSLATGTVAGHITGHMMGH